mgnify:FL=1|jgi:hypothetical protein|tara:strand:+ start:262 stop:609 length:348 start_codon:yes stop_codon:yes gene_type:complete
MTLQFEDVRKAIHSMLNEVVEQGFQHSQNFPNDSDVAHQLIQKSDTELKNLINLARKDNLTLNPDVKQQAFKQTIKQAEKTSLNLLSQLQLMRRRSVLLKKSSDKSQSTSSLLPF